MPRRRRRLRADRVAIVAIAAALALASVVYYVVQLGKVGDPRLAGDKTLLSVAAVSLVVLTLGLGFMTVRNLARVLAGRRRGVIGARLQARVAFAFLILVLAPTLILFWTAIAITRQSVLALASPDLERALRPRAEVARSVYEDAEREAAHFARVLRDDLVAGPIARRPWPPRGDLARELERALKRYDVAAVGLAAPGESPLAVTDPARGEQAGARASELTHLPPSLSASVIETRRPQVFLDRMAYGWRAVVAEPAVLDGEVQAVVWAAVYLPERMVDQLGSLVAPHTEIKELQKRRVPVERLHYALFGLITLLVLFAAVWAGFYLAREVTRPVKELARGTLALAQGDLSFRVRDLGDDEIGRLARSFNHMADEVQRHRRDLVARRRYIETLLEAVPVGVLSIDEDGRVSTANRAALEILELDEDRFGLPHEDVFGPRLEVLARLVDQVLLDPGERVAREVLVETSAGQTSVALVAERFAMPGRGEGVLVVLENLTRLRRAERLAAWGEVARRVAHEIKNPLTPIRLSAERMVRRYKKGDEKFEQVLEEGAETIVREVESLRDLVAEFSRFARMPEVRPREADLNRTAREAVALFGHAHAGVRIDLELAEVLPALRFDEAAVRRCLINLLDNALAVSEENAHIVVSTRPRLVKRAVELEVADNGPGIPEEDRQHLFMPTFSRRAGGTGLGLAIVHQVIADHGGRVRVKDNQGGGTRIIMELPIPFGDVTGDAHGEYAPEDARATGAPAREGEGSGAHDAATERADAASETSEAKKA